MIDAALRAFVRERAGRRCEYCHLPEANAGRLAFQIEHIIARQHGGTDDPDGLWSSVLRRKGGQYELVARMPLDPSLN